MYRQLLVQLSKEVVETKMCSKDYSSIEYKKVPSVAMSRYQKAFGKNDTVRFDEYKKSLESGETTVHATTLYPYDIFKSYKNGDQKISEAQWNALPNYLEGTDAKILMMIDTSSSMYWSESKISGDLYAGHVAQSLAMYFSERLTGEFQNCFLTFNSKPEFVKLKGSFSDKMYAMDHARVGGSTNIEAAFKTILNQATLNHVSVNDMPTMIIIVSDMEFDEGTNGNRNSTAQEMIKNEYATAGYKLPQVVYWCPCSRNKNTPVSFNTSGTCMVSGLSPAIVKSLLGAKDLDPENFTPYSIMMKTISSERYDKVTV